MVIFLTVFLDLLGAGILLPIIPYLVRQFRTDATTLGFLSMAFFAAQFIASPVLGVLSDRFGRRPVLLLSILGTSLGYFLFATATSLPIMMFARVLDGFTGGNISTAQAYLADITPPADRAKSFGLIGMAFGLGFILGPAIGGALSHISVHAPAFGAGILSLFTVILAYFVLPESLPPEHRETKPFHFMELSPVRPLRQIWQRKNLHTLLLAVFVLNFAFSALQSNFSLFTLTRFQYTPQQNAWLFAFIGITAAVVQGYLVRRLNPIMGERKMAVMGMAMLVAGFLVIAFSTVPWHLYASVVLVSGVGFATTSQTAMLSHRVSAREQGWLLGSMQSLLSLTRMAGPLYAGAVFDMLSPGAPYYTGAIWLSVALVLTWYGATHE